MAKRMPQHVAETVLERSGGVCEFWVVGVCTRHAAHLHHRKISGREHRVENLAHICDSCHRYVHAHPRESYENGWLVKMNYEPASVPVNRRGVLVSLRADGTVADGPGKQ